jgi:hypothetical protein
MRNFPNVTFARTAFSSPCSTRSCVNGDLIATRITTMQAIATNAAATHIAQRKRGPRSALFLFGLGFLRT